MYPQGLSIAVGERGKIVKYYKNVMQSLEVLLGLSDFRPILYL